MFCDSYHVSKFHNNICGYCTRAYSILNLAGRKEYTKLDKLKIPFNQMRQRLTTD